MAAASNYPTLKKYQGTPAYKIPTEDRSRFLVELSDQRIEREAVERWQALAAQTAPLAEALKLALPTRAPRTTISLDAEPDTPTTWDTLSADDLAQLDIPPRRAILKEGGAVLFYEASVNQILAWRGVGKTMFSLAIANALASGGTLLNWKADRPRKVLFVDGELPLAQLQERVRDAVAVENRKNIQLFNPERFNKPRGLNLLAPRDFGALKTALKESQSEVLILDSQSTLMAGDPNKIEFQEGRQEVLRQIRWMGVTVIETHHVGKSGLQRGLSKNDDILDVQMLLEKIPDHEPEDGLEFTLRYEKVRHAAGLESGYHVQFVNGVWEKCVTEDLKTAIELFRKNMSERAVAKELGIAPSQAHRLKIKARKILKAELNEGAPLQGRKP